MTKVNEDSVSSEIGTFSLEEMRTSINKRVKEIVEKLTDKSVIDRITSYSEVHSKYEKSSTW